MGNGKVLDIFLSTPSARRATSCRFPCQMLLSISIHALREEGDYYRVCCPAVAYYFYPRPPRGGRQVTARQRELPNLFLSTPSARRATSTRFWSMPRSFNFYPRPPRGGRLLRRVWRVRLPDFYPRPPRGGRRALSDQEYKAVIISIHALREEGDHVPFFLHFAPLQISIHALREEGDYSRKRPPNPWRYFYPRPPRGGRLVMARENGEFEG